MKNIIKPIIFIGSGRCGTTIISEIIFRHESLGWPSNYQERFPSSSAINLLRNFFDNKLWQLHGQKPQLNEVSSFNKILFKPAEAYNFWELITGGQINFSRGFLLNETAAPEQAKKIRRRFSQLLNYQGKERLACKITGPPRIGYIKSIFPDAIFINIIRDPLPTIKSWLNVDFWQDKGKNKLWWTGAYTPREEEWAINNAGKPELLAAIQYRKLLEVTAAEVEQHHAKCLTVRYEEFVADPAATIHKILDFAKLGKSKNVENYLKQNRIYDQNKKNKKENLITGKRPPENADVQLILNGEYAY